MSRELVYLPTVSLDLAEGKNYYEALSPGRGGLRFENAFREALRQIRNGVVTHGIAFEHFHRVNLQRFPYTLYYRLAGDKAVIAAVLYNRWDPKRIQRALGKRLT